MALSGCGSSRNDGGDDCTLRAVGEETGAGSIRATLSVPEQYISGAEITNGGIAVDWDDCDYSLNAFLSNETADYIIASAPTNTLTNSEHGTRLVDALLYVWKFQDASGEPRFFVTSVGEMAPINKPRTALEAQRFELPASEQPRLRGPQQPSRACLRECPLTTP